MRRSSAPRRSSSCRRRCRCSNGLLPHCLQPPWAGPCRRRRRGCQTRGGLTPPKTRIQTIERRTRVKGNIHRSLLLSRSRMASPQVSAETPSTRGRGGSASPPSEKSPLRFAIALLVTVSLAVGAHYAFCAVSAGQGSSDTARRFCGMGTSEPSAAVLNKGASPVAQRWTPWPCKHAPHSQRPLSCVSGHARVPRHERRRQQRRRRPSSPP